ncbi:hypothetical protein NAEGRDRAFT_58312 [Naegleria gruberi]|uniref:Uncharacterized protein n=1 Tax=Naegleria gruberi TaxID=5762 RepID=D2VIG5_NAEGR|nr:uncharacterized protein NAEGRDRAFT_58312 [Naegleria gruberi]EFC43353.1 hypothetical protein NAEGRDRAFT_58312 [Naegleria gruberi]|eukprot:XP_002676097.1 hypothetical protein NAEGRDRAFT_58312 [Naegleria gruberi strain NEG-M]
MGNSSSPIPNEAGETPNFLDLHHFQLKGLEKEIKNISVYNYETGKTTLLTLNPTKKPQLVLISDQNVNLSLDAWVTVSNNKNTKTNWTGRFEMKHKIPRFNLKDPDLTITLFEEIHHKMAIHFESKKTKSLNVVCFGALGDGKSGLLNNIAQALGCDNITFQSGRFFEATDSDHSVTKSSEVGVIPIRNGAEIRLWNVPGFYETKQKGVVEREPAKNYFQHLLRGLIPPNSGPFEGCNTVPNQYEEEFRIQLVIFTIDVTHIKTLEELKPLFAKYTKMCVEDHKINYMFVLTKFDNLSDRYLAFDGVALLWKDSKFTTVAENGHLFANLATSPEFTNIEQLITQTFKNGVVFPIINRSDENRKKFIDDESGILSLIQKNHVLRFMKYAVEMGIESSKWQNRS